MSSGFISVPPKTLSFWSLSINLSQFPAFTGANRGPSLGLVIRGWFGGGGAAGVFPVVWPRGTPPETGPLLAARVHGESCIPTTIRAPVEIYYKRVPIPMNTPKN